MTAPFAVVTHNDDRALKIVYSDDEQNPVGHMLAAIQQRAEELLQTQLPLIANIVKFRCGGTRPMRFVLAPSSVDGQRMSLGYAPLPWNVSVKSGCATLNGKEYQIAEWDGPVLWLSYYSSMCDFQSHVDYSFFYCQLWERSATKPYHRKPYDFSVRFERITGKINVMLKDKIAGLLLKQYSEQDAYQLLINVRNILQNAADPPQGAFSGRAAIVANRINLVEIIDAETRQSLTRRLFDAVQTAIEENASHKLPNIMDVLGPLARPESLQNVKLVPQDWRSDTQLADYDSNAIVWPVKSWLASTSADCTIIKWDGPIMNLTITAEAINCGLWYGDIKSNGVSMGNAYVFCVRAEPIAGKINDMLRRTISDLLAKQHSDLDMYQLLMDFRKISDYIPSSWAFVEPLRPAAHAS